MDNELSNACSLSDMYVDLRYVHWTPSIVPLPPPLTPSAPHSTVTKPKAISYDLPSVAQWLLASLSSEVGVDNKFRTATNPNHSSNIIQALD
jgi:hypothetical protein